MIEKQVCLDHAAVEIKRLFKGQKMLVDTDFKKPGIIIRCNNQSVVQCQKVAAVRVLIFNPNESVLT